jgi:hypothetical protein
MLGLLINGIFQEFNTVENRLAETYMHRPLFRGFQYIIVNLKPILCRHKIYSEVSTITRLHVSAVEGCFILLYSNLSEVSLYVQ